MINCGVVLNPSFSHLPRPGHWQIPPATPAQHRPSPVPSRTPLPLPTPGSPPSLTWARAVAIPLASVRLPWSVLVAARGIPWNAESPPVSPLPRTFLWPPAHSDLQSLQHLVLSPPCFPFAHTAPATPASSLALQHIRPAPASEPLHWLFPLLKTSLPRIPSSSLIKHLLSKEVLSGQPV